MKLDVKQIKNYITFGKIRRQVHYKYSNVWILNYTPETQFKKDWDELTLACRGLIVDIQTGEILARPMSKFFNIEELFPNGEYPSLEGAEIYEKKDGSLIIATSFEGEILVASKGSFNSDHVGWANELLTDSMKSKILEWPGYTFCFELIYPENRIVCNYGEEKALYLITVISNDDGKEVFGTFEEFNCLPNLRELSSKSIYELKDEDIKNHEGYVIKFRDGSRAKVKFPTYIELHRLKEDINPITISEWIEAREYDNNIKYAPDEFYKECDAIKEILVNRYNELEIQVNTLFENIIFDMTMRKMDSRAVFAEQVFKNATPGTESLYFAKYDNKDLHSYFWKQIRKEIKTLWKG